MRDGKSHAVKQAQPTCWPRLLCNLVAVQSSLVAAKPIDEMAPPSGGRSNSHGRVAQSPALGPTLIA